MEGDGRLPPDEQVRQIRDAGLPVPSFTNWSGGKSCHAYWKLDHPITPDKFREMQKRLIQLLLRVEPDLKVDKSVHSPCQVMRLPGGLHPDRKERTTIRSISGHVYKLDEWRERWGKTAGRARCIAVLEVPAATDSAAVDAAAAEAPAEE